MPDYETHVELPMDTQVGADVCVNTWHMFDSGLVGPSINTKIQSWHSALQTFYNALSSVLANSILATNVRMKTFDLDDPKPRQPLVNELKPITEPTTGTGYPHELAIVMSFHSEFLSGVNPARRRGRVYLGPLKSSVGGTEAADPKVLATPRATIAAAGAALITASAADPGAGFVWCTRSTFNFDDQFGVVQGGYVDNSFDVQRRRGTDSSARTNFP